MAGINSAHVSAGGKGRTHARGERRAAIVQAAADVLRESGPAAVTYRSVGSRAQCAISLIGYYFTSLDELLSEAGSSVMRSWADRTERVAIEAEQGDPPQSLEEAVDLILTACLPDAESLEVLYFQLVNAARSIPVTRSYQEGRDRLDDAMARVLAWAGVSVPADLVTAIVDGAAVAALSEGREIREVARGLLSGVCVDSWQPRQSRRIAASESLPKTAQPSHATRCEVVELVLDGRIRSVSSSASLVVLGTQPGAGVDISRQLGQGCCADVLGVLHGFDTVALILHDADRARELAQELAQACQDRSDWNCRFS